MYIVAAYLFFLDRGKSGSLLAITIRRGGVYLAAPVFYVAGAVRFVSFIFKQNREEKRRRRAAGPMTGIQEMRYYAARAKHMGGLFF
jgi:hypothetical protein